MNFHDNMIRKMALTLCFVLLAAALLWPSQSEAFGPGSRGPDVYAVQGMMKSLGYYSGTIDGIYGPNMASGVRYFQKRYGLTVTGNVDSKTLQSILWAYSELKIGKSGTGSGSSNKSTPTPSTPSAQLGADEKQMLQLVNQERTKRGISALTADLELSKVAEIKSADMVNNNYFSHQSPKYGSPFEMMRNFGIQSNTAAENIACNQTVEAAHKALMESTGHRDNILSTKFKKIGIGIVDGGPCGKMFTQQFTG